MLDWWRTVIRDGACNRWLNQWLEQFNWRCLHWEEQLLAEFACAMNAPLTTPLSTTQRVTWRGAQYMSNLHTHLTYMRICIDWAVVDEKVVQYSTYRLRGKAANPLVCLANTLTATWVNQTHFFQTSTDKSSISDSDLNDVLFYFNYLPPF